MTSNGGIAVVVQDCALGQGDRQTDRHCAMSHKGMTTAWPPQQPPENSHTGQSTQVSLEGPPASAQLLPATKCHVPTCTHINIQSHTHIKNILSGVWLHTEDEYDCHYHTSGLCFIGVITSPSHAPSSLNVIRFQEHWAHKPGHVLRCPVCQNNSAVCNTVSVWFHFNLPRYCGTLE